VRFQVWIDIQDAGQWGRTPGEWKSGISRYKLFIIVSVPPPGIRRQGGPPRRLLSKGSDRSTFRIFLLSFSLSASLCFLPASPSRRRGRREFRLWKKGEKCSNQSPIRTMI
jgi:hypothetical protein